MVEDMSTMEIPSFLHTLEIIGVYPKKFSDSMLVLNLPTNLRPRRELLLQSIKIPWNNPVWSNLTRIELIDLDSFQDCKPYTMHEFFNMLKRCRDLEILRITDSHIRSKDFYLTQVLPLHKLCRLELQNSADDISTFMSNIAIPATSNVILNPTKVNPFKFDFRQILRSDLSSIPVMQLVDTISLNWSTAYSSSFVVGETSKQLSNGGGSFRLVIPCSSQDDIALPGNTAPSQYILGVEHTKNLLTRIIPDIFNPTHSFSAVRKLNLTRLFITLAKTGLDYWEISLTSNTSHGRI
ncbi:hypothetical protein C8Q75DRAFT_804916 [Abortiporus biennis]|nr:hypothetical protein C8Q75DRAFT_804916 [Abortiporus biennis]